VVVLVLEDMFFWVYVYVLEVDIPVGCKLVLCDGEI
jgi:hypothetical protein